MEPLNLDKSPTVCQMDSLALCHLRHAWHFWVILKVIVKRIPDEVEAIQDDCRCSQTLYHKHCYTAHGGGSLHVRTLWFDDVLLMANSRLRREAKVLS